jgi:predicted transcriptional regulator
MTRLNDNIPEKHKNRAILKYKLNNSTSNTKNSHMEVLIMQNLKENVIAMIQQMPDDASIADIMAELYFRQKVDKGLKELDEGKGISHEEAKGRLKKWLS